jgi:hypothetical protein
MMQEVLDAENEVSQATDDAVDMNIGAEESIENNNNNNNNTSNKKEDDSSDQIPHVSNINSEIQSDEENKDDNNKQKDLHLDIIQLLKSHYNLHHLSPTLGAYQHSLRMMSTNN